MAHILTVRFDPTSQQHFEGMRQHHYPREQNIVPAHMTLFHVLPQVEETLSTLAAIACTTKAFTLAVSGLRSLGRGVAYTLAAPEVDSLHGEIAFAFANHLTRQDQQKFHPHVVIQNKSTSEQADALLGLLRSSFQPFTVRAEGLDLWNYLDGPWELARQLDFVD